MKRRTQSKRRKWSSCGSDPISSPDRQLQRMGKLSLPVREEQPLQRSPSFANTHLSLTKLVRSCSPSPIRSKGADDSMLPFFCPVGRVPPRRFSPRIQQTETDRVLSFLLHSNLCGDIRLLFAGPPHSRRRIPGAATTVGRYSHVLERISVYH